MRISDWSSDVCSSDLQARVARVEALEGILHARLVVAHDPATQLQVLLDGHAYEHAVTLDEIGDDLAQHVLRLRPDQLLAVVPDLAGLGAEIAVESQNAHASRRERVSPYM